MAHKTQKYGEEVSACKVLIISHIWGGKSQLTHLRDQRLGLYWVCCATELNKLRWLIQIQNCQFLQLLSKQSHGAKIMWLVSRIDSEGVQREIRKSSLLHPKSCSWRYGIKGWNLFNNSAPIARSDKICTSCFFYLQIWIFFCNFAVDLKNFTC